MRLAGASEYSEQQIAHGGQPVTALQYIATARFRFESLQNWLRRAGRAFPGGKIAPHYSVEAAQLARDALSTDNYFA